MKSNVIEVKNLKKSFKNVKAVDDVSFIVKERELYAFLGINGAGKSTTINIITGVLLHDEGEVRVFNKNVLTNSIEIKKELGIVFQTSGLDQFLSVYDNLYFRGSLYILDKKELRARIKELSEKLEFSEFLNRPLNKLSGGQKRKVDIARAIIHRPKLLILDEPTTGLDPKTRKLIWLFLNDLREKEGLTIFLTTHYMEEAAQADYVEIIDEGRILTQGTPSFLKNKYSNDFIKIYKAGISESAFSALLSDPKYCFVEHNDYYEVNIKTTSEVKEMLLQYPDAFDDFEVYKGNMDDVFLNVTGKNIGE